MWRVYSLLFLTKQEKGSSLSFSFNLPLQVYEPLLTLSQELKIHRRSLGLQNLLQILVPIKGHNFQRKHELIPTPFI